MKTNTKERRRGQGRGEGQKSDTSAGGRCFGGAFVTGNEWKREQKKGGADKGPAKAKSQILMQVVAVLGGAFVARNI